MRQATGKSKHNSCRGVAHLQVIGHSMGAWAAYEFLILARANGVPMPVNAFLSAMPQPDIPFEQRPWKQQASLDEVQFQVGSIALSLYALCQQSGLRDSIQS